MMRKDMKSRILYIGIILFIFNIAFVKTLFSQTDNHFTITAHIKGLKDKVILIEDYYVEISRYSDTVYCDNGYFKLKGEINTPTLFNLYLGYKYVSFFLDNSDIAINGHIDSLQFLRIENAKANAAYQIVKPMLDSLTEASYEAFLETDANKKKTEKQKNDDIDLFWKMQDYVKNAALDFIIKNKQSVVSPYLARKFFAENYQILDSLYGNYDFSESKNENELYIKQRLEKMKSVQPGKSAPDFIQSDTSGNQYQLSAFRGKYVLLDFWASWCGPCRAETPNLMKAYHLYKDKGLEIISVSVDEDKRKWKDAIIKDGMIWIQLSDEKGWKNIAARMYDVSAVPSIFLIDKEGRIIAKKLRGEALQQKLKEIFD